MLTCTRTHGKAKLEHQPDGLNVAILGGVDHAPAVLVAQSVKEIWVVSQEVLCLPAIGVDAGSKETIDLGHLIVRAGPREQFDNLWSALPHGQTHW
jgi:hypothetical protein